MKTLAGFSFYRGINSVLRIPVLGPLCVNRRKSVSKCLLPCFDHCRCSILLGDFHRNLLTGCIEKRFNASGNRMISVGYHESAYMMATSNLLVILAPTCPLCSQDIDIPALAFAPAFLAFLSFPLSRFLDGMIFVTALVICYVSTSSFSIECTFAAVELEF